ncbi:LysR family transcriptional regulator, partial [bacterium LRH843]|nr:LysR family transcriptional regulator [bacterium LRH843]
DFQQVELLGKWANRKLLLAARCFDQLAVDYQRFSQFLLSQHDQLRPH